MRFETEWKGQLVFVVETECQRLWISDGTEAGTVSFFDLELDGRPLVLGELIPAGDQLFFTAFHHSWGFCSCILSRG